MNCRSRENSTMNPTKNALLIALSVVAGLGFSWVVRTPTVQAWMDPAWRNNGCDYVVPWFLKGTIEDCVAWPKNERPSKT